ncbi:hypothetical protein N9Y61_06555, partial [Paracoccaceae bacterium]|nr:hypothetical protein [Paracoccaceae bacterium]
RPGESARLGCNHSEQQVLIYSARLPPLRALAPPHAPQHEVKLLRVNSVGAAEEAVDPPKSRELAPDCGVLEGELVGLDKVNQHAVCEWERRNAFLVTPVDKVRDVCVV